MSGAPQARTYSVSDLPARITGRALVGAVKARWAFEQAHRQLKVEFGPHFEGCS